MGGGGGGGACECVAMGVTNDLTLNVPTSGKKEYQMFFIVKIAPVHNCVSSKI